jgi:hypothetical protein
LSETCCKRRDDEIPLARGTVIEAEMVEKEGTLGTQLQSSSHPVSEHLANWQLSAATSQLRLSKVKNLEEQWPDFCTS